MISITNGTQVKTVTNGAFESVFKPLGYIPVADVKEPVEDVKEDVKEPEPQTEEEFEQEVKISWGKEQELKPINSWTKEELKEYCVLNNIDTSEAKKVEDVKNIIKDWIADNR